MAKKIQISLTVDKEIYEQVKLAAAEYGVSISQYVILCTQGKIVDKYLVKSNIKKDAE